MSASLFFKHINNPLPPITYRLLETFTSMAEENPEADAGTVLQASLEACGHTQAFTLEQLASILESLKDIPAKHSMGDDKPPSSPSGKKSFGQDYLDWVNSLNIERLLLAISDYDFTTACTYYSEVPIEAIAVIADVYFRSSWLIKQSQLEAAVVGAGGDLGSSKPAPGYDMSDDTAAKQAEAKLKSIGF